MVSLLVKVNDTGGEVAGEGTDAKEGAGEGAKGQVAHGELHSSRVYYALEPGNLSVPGFWGRFVGLAEPVGEFYGRGGYSPSSSSVSSSTASMP